ncbi:3-ketoacyl-CoA thiolase, mitochondrial [Rhizophlyctis rosea]|nr:3-ketoacyl-CoA thiolase, mitochondrial [Rhizophlyctis rosea]
MGITAENLGKQYGVTREDCDKHALLTQQRWGAANAAGRFKAEIEPIEIPGKKGPEVVSSDEHPRPQTTIEQLGKLKSVFVDNGLVTAGYVDVMGIFLDLNITTADVFWTVSNASGIADGAASLVVASEEAVKQYNIKPLARLVSWFYCGVDPNIMGIGPVPAIRGALKRAGLTLKDMDIVELNEAFAAQFLAVERELGFDMEKTNKHGGAVAIGHPLGASGARITAHIVHELQRTGGRYGLGAACIGGGQGIALIVERA